MNVGKRILLACLLLAITPSNAPAIQQDESKLDLRSIPIADWLNGKEEEEIPWSISSYSTLQMDQRIELVYSVTVQARDLNRSGKTHELFLISRVSNPEGEWLIPTHALRQTADDFPDYAYVHFRRSLFVQPGEYVLWLILYDRVSGDHSVSRRNIRVPGIPNDPLPDLYASLPLVESAREVETELGRMSFLRNELFLRVENKRPIALELIAPLGFTNSEPGSAVAAPMTTQALVPLSQIELAQGTMSLAGLDITRQQVLFEQNGFKDVQWVNLMNAFRKTESQTISLEALENRKNNAVFFRDYLNQRLQKAMDSPEKPFRVFIVVSNQLVFDRGADLTPLQANGDCDCRIYHLRLSPYAYVNDDLEKVMKLLQPKTLDIRSPRDLRDALGTIIEEMGRL